MRIYAVADLHGRKDRLELAARIAAESGSDIMVVAGDVAGWRSGARACSMLEDMPVPVVAVRGNSDRRLQTTTRDDRNNVSWLDLERKELSGVSIAGIGGTFLLPLDSRLAFFENRLVEKAIPLVKGASILVAHPPPKGVLDRVFGKLHAGSTGLRRIVLETAVPLLICGHVHEDAGAGWLGHTLVVNCSMGGKGAGALIEYVSGKRPEVEMVMPGRLGKVQAF